MSLKSKIIDECLNTLKRDDVKEEIKELMKPVIDMLLKEIYPYIYLSIIFVIISFISRGLRFFIVSYLSFKFGETFTTFMHQHGSKWFTLMGIFIVIISAIIYLFIKSHD